MAKSRRYELELLLSTRESRRKHDVALIVAAIHTFMHAKSRARSRAGFLRPSCNAVKIFLQLSATGIWNSGLYIRPVKKCSFCHLERVMTPHLA